VLIVSALGEVENGGGSEQSGHGRHDDVAQPTRQVEHSISEIHLDHLLVFISRP